MQLADLVNHAIPPDIVDAWRTRWSHGKLLPFQTMAFTEASFWPPGPNLLVQGPTSSGKTFIGEALAARAFANRLGQAIYLVPFRVLVAEKFDLFERTFGRPPLDYRVYPSSSDFHDYDSAIASGHYDLAVMVYEKLLAMLSRSARVLSKCELVIVDEIQMIRDGERGGKLELILTRLLSHQSDPPIRIVGLGGVASDLSTVRAWLGANPITANARPGVMAEGVCDRNGLYRYRLIGSSASEAEVKTETIPLGSPKPKKGDDLIIALARHHIGKGEKVLIFRGSRGQTELTAHALAQFLPRADIAPALKQTLTELEDTDVREHLSSLLPHGVAYHNASLTFDERRIIEQEFLAEAGALKAVVATETLAMGVNLPADVVIIGDLSRPAAQGPALDPRLENITVEEYRNAIGRAGRYGLGTALTPRSYLLASSPPEADARWRQYVEGTNTPVDSTFLHPDELLSSHRDKGVPLSPFVLSRLAEERLSYESLLNSYFQNSLVYSKALNRTKGLASEIERSLALLSASGLVSPDPPPRWQVTQLGEQVAQSLMSLSSLDIIQRIITSLRTWNRDELWIGDVLFDVCGTPEIELVPTLPLSRQEQSDTSRIQKLWKAAQDAPRTDPDGKVFKLIQDSQKPSIVDARRLKRALFLHQWCQGHSSREIRRKFDALRLSWGDLRTLGERVGWVVEAVANLCSIWDDARRYARPLRALGAELQYGVPAQVAELAKLRVPGLHRGFLLKILRGHTKSESWEDFFSSNTRLPIPPPIEAALKQALVRRNERDTKEGKTLHASRVKRLVETGTIAEEWVGHVDALYTAQGDQFEKAIILALEACHLNASIRRPEANSASEPDVVIQFGEASAVLGECKRRVQDGQRVGWREASQILGCNTLGLNPIENKFVVGYWGFDRHAIEMNSSQEKPLLLIPIDSFVEACFWVGENDGQTAFENFLRKAGGHFFRWEICGELERWR